MTLQEAKKEMIRCGYLPNYVNNEIKSKRGIIKDLEKRLAILMEHLSWNEDKLATKWGTIEKDIFGREIEGSFKPHTSNDTNLAKRAIKGAKEDIEETRKLIADIKGGK